MAVVHSKLYITKDFSLRSISFSCGRSSLQIMNKFYNSCYLALIHVNLMKVFMIHFCQWKVHFITKCQAIATSCYMVYLIKDYNLSKLPWVCVWGQFNSFVPGHIMCSFWDSSLRLASGENVLINRYSLENLWQQQAPPQQRRRRLWRTLDLRSAPILR